MVLEDKNTIASYGLKDGDSLVIKDLGPQISWRTVFFIEYLGPLLIHQLFFLYYLNTSSPSFTQMYNFCPFICNIDEFSLAYACASFHFLKREYETFFIHRFSHATMPLRNLFKNCGHYWVLSGILISYNLYTPNYISPKISIVLLSLLIFLIAEIGNFRTHTILRSLRPEGTTHRAIPRGLGFDYVSCPNYTFEIVAWIAFAFMTGLWSSWLFAVVATAQMYLWAIKKHRQYRHEFPDYPKGRKILIPFLL